MTETGDLLRATSDELRRDLEALSTLEDEKRSLVPGDPRLVDLASRIEQIAGRLLQSSGLQRELSEQAHDLVRQGSPAAPDAPIEATPRPIPAILADWRDAERRVEAAAPGSAEQREAQAHVASLREEYRAAHEAARRAPD